MGAVPRRCNGSWRLRLVDGRRCCPPTPGCCPPTPSRRRCQARLGSYNWAGSQSSSGSWVTPAFQLHVSRLDVIDPRPPVVPGAIRQPRLLAATGGGASSCGQTAAVAVAGSAAAADGLADVRLADGQTTGQVQQSPEAAAQAEVEAMDGQQQQQQRRRRQQRQQQQPCATFFTHLVLDCDGVMVDSERASCEALRRAVLQVQKKRHFSDCQLLEAGVPPG